MQGLPMPLGPVDIELPGPVTPVHEYLPSAPVYYTVAMGQTQQRASGLFRGRVIGLHGLGLRLIRHQVVQRKAE